MTELFTGKAISKSVSLPEGVWLYFEGRRTNIGIPVSRQIQDLIEEGLRYHDRMMVDRPGEYITATIGE